MKDSMLELLGAPPKCQDAVGRTVRELGADLGIGQDQVRARLREMIAAGTVVCVWEPRVSLDGRSQRIAAYRLAGRKAAKR